MRCSLVPRQDAGLHWRQRFKALGLTVYGSRLDARLQHAVPSFMVP
jgi:hypothetical protein